MSIRNSPDLWKLMGTDEIFHCYTLIHDVNDTKVRARGYGAEVFLKSSGWTTLHNAVWKEIRWWMNRKADTDWKAEEMQRNKEEAALAAIIFGDIPKDNFGNPKKT